MNNGQNILEDIIFFFFKNETTLAYRLKFQHWLLQNTSEQDKAIRQLWDTLNLTADASTYRNLREINRQIDKTEKVNETNSGKIHPLYRQILKVASVVLLPLLISATTWLILQKHTPDNTAKTYVNHKGIEKIVLPDSTVVYLNAGSTLTCTGEYATKERKVYLEGEACFKVQRDEKHPFIVSVFDDKCHAKVLGTTFNVQAYREDSLLQTTLVEGSLLLKVKDRQGRAKERLLSPSDKFTFNKQSGNLNIEKIRAESDIEWTDGKLRFNDTPLPDVAKILSRYYQTEIILKDKSLCDNVFTGTFDNESLTEVLNCIASASQIRYRHVTAGDSNGIILLSK